MQDWRIPVGYERFIELRGKLDGRLILPQQTPQLFATTRMAPLRPQFFDASRWMLQKTLVDECAPGKAF